MKLRIRFLLVLMFLVFSPWIVKAQIDNGVRWQDMNGVAIPIPPQEHPRLYLRSVYL